MSSLESFANYLISTWNHVFSTLQSGNICGYLIYGPRFGTAVYALLVSNTKAFDVFQIKGAGIYGLKMQKITFIKVMIDPN